MKPEERTAETRRTRSFILLKTEDLRALGVSAVCCFLFTACGKASVGDALGDGRPVPELAAAEVQWTSPDGGLAALAAVAELGEQTYVFGEGGAQVFAGGVPLSSDATVTSWKSAAAIPAADGVGLGGLWAVGLAADGKLWRVRGTGVLEAISDRYALGAAPVADLAPLGQGRTAFALGTELAIADGATVTRFDAATQSVAGAGGRAAWLEGDLVRRLDPGSGRVESWRLPGARLVAVNSEGRLAVTTERALYLEAGTLNLNLAYTAVAPISALASAGARFWFSAGGRLGAVERGAIQRTAAAAVPADARLVGSPSGDVWALTSGTLRRFTSAGASDFAVWQQTVMPVFARVCSSCHLPSGTAGVDLASYQRWKEKKRLIYERVVEQRPSPMPPQASGVALSDADREAIRAWSGG